MKELDAFVMARLTPGNWCRGRRHYTDWSHLVNQKIFDLSKQSSDCLDKGLCGTKI